METNEAPVSGQKDRLESKQTYMVEGNPVKVSTRRFVPKEVSPLAEEKSEDNATIYLPGWSITEQAKSIEALCQTFADVSGNNTFAVDTRMNTVTDRSLIQQAEAVRQFIKQQKFRRVTIAGNSAGGAEAINVASSLQDDPDIVVNGLVLLDSMGLHDQTTLQLTKRYLHDMAKTQLTRLHPPTFRERENYQSQSKDYLNAGTIETIREVLRSGIQYPGRLLQEMRNMVKKNPQLEKITSPVILIQGAQDKLVPAEMIVPRQTEPEPAIDKAIEALKARKIEALQQKKTIAANAHEREKIEGAIKSEATDTHEGLRTQMYRKKILEGVFPNSPHVQIILPEKTGYHNLSHTRPRQVATAAWGLLNRWHRQEKSTPTAA